MKTLTENFKTTLNSVSQVVFIENWQFGLICLVVIGIYNLQCAIAMFIALFLHNLVALKLYDAPFVQSGVSSFNLAIAMLVMYVVYGGFSSMAGILLIVGVYTMIMYITKATLDSINIAFLSLPSILTSFAMYAISLFIPSLFGMKQIFQLTPIVSMLDGVTLGTMQHFFMDIGNTYFQANLLFSLVLIITYALLEKEYLLYYITAYLSSTLVYSLIDPTMIGVFSAFNGTLVLIVLQILGILKIDKSYLWVAPFYSIVMVLVEILLTKIMGPTHLPLLSMPFYLTLLGAQIYLNIKKKRAMSE